jgi:hypothetical protein
MAKPYSHDLRAKVINAIELDGLKKSQASELFNISRNTIDLWLKRKAETGDFNPYLTVLLVIATKLQIGKSSVSLPKLTAIKPKSKWLSCGKARLATGRFPVPWAKSGLREKKDLRLPRTR